MSGLPYVPPKTGGGRLFGRSVVFEFAWILHARRPMAAGDLDMLPSWGWPTVAWLCTSGCINRIDMSTCSGWRHRLIFGCVSEIPKNASGNPDTPLRSDVVAKLPYIPGAHVRCFTTIANPDWLSWHWIRTTAYRSNALAHPPPDTAIRLGSVGHGVVSDRYNGSNRATLEAWTLVGRGGWRGTSGDAITSRNDANFATAPIFRARGMSFGTTGCFWMQSTEVVCL